MLSRHALLRARHALPRARHALLTLQAPHVGASSSFAHADKKSAPPLASTAFVDAPVSAAALCVWRRHLPASLFREALDAPPHFSRWSVPLAAIATHASIGSIYAFSVFSSPLTRELGVVASAAGDWSLTSVVPVFSTAIFFLGATAAVAGRWLEDVGPRLVGGAAAVCFGGGLVVSAAAVHFHSLPALYIGYGVLGGMGLGLGYVAPVSTLLKWFPDRRGLATGLAIMGFGGGAVVAAPVAKALMGAFARAPERLGANEKESEGEGEGGTGTGTDTGIELVTEGGKRLARAGDRWVEVLVPGVSDVAALNWEDVTAGGVYVVGTGSTGAAATLLLLGGVYTALMGAGAAAYRLPPRGWAPPVSVSAALLVPPLPVSPLLPRFQPQSSVHIDTALRTPQFWLLWSMFSLNVSAGIGLLGVAATMLRDVFPGADAGTAVVYVAALSAANLIGRLSLASASDHLGRRNTFHGIFGLGAPLYLTLPLIAGWAAAGAPGDPAPLLAFGGASCAILALYGGGFACIPAYLADVFGTAYVGAIHGRLLTAWSAAGVTGPLLFARLRQASADTALEDLAAVVDPNAFAAAFGAPLSELQTLIDARTVTISRLLEIVPGAIDPTPHLYDSTALVCAGMLSVAALCNACVRPVAARHLMAAGVDEKDRV